KLSWYATGCSREQRYPTCEMGYWSSATMESMKFDPTAYGPLIAGILALDGNGERLMPLVSGSCSSAEALARIQTAGAGALFPNARAPQAALSGLYLYFSCLDQAHETAQSIDTPDGAYWHGIMHRQEPDPDNARYWFGRVGSHPIFPELANVGQAISLPSFGPEGRWDPMQFIDICERARRDPDSPLARTALAMQRAEWQLLFDYCARDGSRPL